MTPRELRAVCTKSMDAHGDRAQVLLELPGPMDFHMELWSGGPYGVPISGAGPGDEASDRVVAMFDPKIILQFLDLYDEADPAVKASLSKVTIHGGKKK